jgi:galactokinase
VGDVVSRSFDALFGRAATAHGKAPGRVNLIGEHTDYNDGFVLPIATPQQTTIALAPRPDRRVRAWSRDVGDENGWVTYELGHEARTGAWGDYIAGVTAALHADGFQCGGFDARIESDLPLGAGLASSAALEVALLRALGQAFDLTIDGVTIARLAQRAETELVGAPVGIMDQMAASLADRRAALFLDTRDLSFERIPLPPAFGLIVIHSGVTHRHAGGEYRTRRAECAEASRLLGVDSLRRIELSQLDGLALPEPLIRRVRHVVSENARVVDASRALYAADAAGFGRLMNASHESMKRDYEISTPEIDRLVELAQRAAGVFGARLTGGGFGGSIVALAEAASAIESAGEIAAQYERSIPRQPTILVPSALPTA